jgi:hypothetical protein
VLLRHEGVGPATIRKLRGEAEPEAPKPKFIGDTKRAAEE